MFRKTTILSRSRTLAVLGFIIVFSGAECWAEEPTLARLSFRVPPERMAEFEVVYRAKVAPMLKRHGLSESSRHGRATVDSVFSRLFEAKTPAEVTEMGLVLAADSMWTGLLRDLGAAFNTAGSDSLIRHGFGLYAAPAGLGQSVSAGFGKVVPAGCGKGHWRTYDVTDGFGGGAGGMVLQDRQGYLWFATWDRGVSRYDGQTWTTFTTQDGLAHNGVLSILQNREGNLWFGTNGGGVSRYDGQTWITFTTEDGLASNSVCSILQDREGNLWFGTNGGVSRYDGHTWTTFTTEDGLANNRVLFASLEDREGNLWFSTKRGVSRYDGHTWTTFTKEDGLGADSPYWIFQDRAGNLWFSTIRGVSRYDGHTWTTFTTKDGLAHNAVWTTFQDWEGNLWFGTGRGVSRYDGHTWTTFTTEDGLADNRVRSGLQDREGNLWFRTQAGTVSRYGGQTWTTFTTDDGLADNQVGSILQDREGNLWFGTPGGLSRYDREGRRHLNDLQDRSSLPNLDESSGGQTWTTFTTEDGLADNGVSSILQDREGNLWFAIGNRWQGTESGVSRYDGQTWTTFTTEDGLAHNGILSILQDREGNLWFGTNGGGVSRYDGQTWTTFTTEDGLADNQVGSILQDREGNLWFGTGSGVSRYDREGRRSGEPSSGGTWITFTAEDGLAHNRVSSILQDREGNLWFGTQGGLSRYDEGRGRSSESSGEGTWTTFTTEDGLADNGVSSILQDREGNLWFGTHSGGVSRYDGRVFQNLTAKDGLAGNWVSAIFQDRNGNLWFGTSQTALTRYRPPPPSPPPVFIDAVVADRRYEGISELTVPSGTGLVTFEFRGISFKTRPDAMVYRYRLTGYEGDWQTTHARRVEYQNLPRGRYTFEVQAVDRDLVYSETPATLALTVHLPYERIGLLSALGIAVVLVGWQTVRVIRRDRRLSIANHELEDKTDELENANSALSDANKELFGLNRQLQKERFVERIRGEVQAMEKAEDFDNLLSTLAGDLNAVDLHFTTCGIDVLDEPVDNPTMLHFDTNGFHYTAYTIDPNGIVSRESYRVSSPFPPVNLETLERFIAGEPWQGMSSETAIVEIPIAQYGRLRLTAPERNSFTDEEIETLQDFATAIALGYTRYLDFVNLEAANSEIQMQTERKSAFLASMSHELRTPMNAIKGFTNLVLRREKDLSDRNRDNLEKVTQASDHLLAMINDILDLSKIEAGRMDVNPKPFDMKALVTYCCATVSPLLEEKPDVKLEQDVADEIERANTDQGRIRQMLINLLSNAIKFTDSGSVSVKALQENDYLILSVSDTGQGIPDDEVLTIFDEYRQVEGSDKEHKGTGLGLSITKQFAELLGGSIGVESQMGKGSTFTVRVPMVYEAD